VGGILVLTATEVEAAALARGLSLPRIASPSGRAYAAGPLHLAVVGLRASLLPAMLPLMLPGDVALTRGRPLVISAGLCGGLDPALRAGDLVLPSGVVDARGERHEVARRHHARAQERLEGRARTGDLLEVADVVATPAAKAALFMRTAAVAVDMESAHILRAAAAAGCPALVVRAVSDAAGEALPPPLLDVVAPGGRLRPGRALGAVLASPAAWPALLRLRRATAAALATVSEAIQGIVEFSPALAED